MATWKTKTAIALLWPAGALGWLGWHSLSTGLRRNRTTTLGLIALGGVCVGGIGAEYPQESAATVRAAVLLPFSIPALGWGLAQGGSLHLQGNMIVVSDMAGGHGTRSTITVGQVVLTSKEDVRDELLAHEATHGDQWALFGVLTPPLYYLADVIGGGAEHNIFEVAAGLEDGGYDV